MVNPVIGNEKIILLHSEYGLSSETSISLTSFFLRLLSILYSRILRLVKKDNNTLICFKPDMFDIVVLLISFVNIIYFIFIAPDKCPEENIHQIFTCNYTLPLQINKNDFMISIHILKPYMQNIDCSQKTTYI